MYGILVQYNLLIVFQLKKIAIVASCYWWFTYFLSLKFKFLVVFVAAAVVVVFDGGAVVVVVVVTVIRYVVAPLLMLCLNYYVSTSDTKLCKGKSKVSNCIST